MDDSLRRTVHKGTTKIERHHKFAKHLAFGAGGHLRSNNPADQERAIIYNELVTNAVALQNVVDQTQALHTLKSKGVNIRAADLAFLTHLCHLAQQTLCKSITYEFSEGVMGKYSVDP